MINANFSLLKAIRIVGNIDAVFLNIELLNSCECPSMLVGMKSELPKAKLHELCVEVKDCLACAREVRTGASIPLLTITGGAAERF